MRFFLLCFFTFCFVYANGMKPYFHPTISLGDSSIENKKNSYLLSFDFGSNKTFSGRKDTIRQPYLSPSFVFTHKTNFFLMLSAYSIKNKLDNAYLCLGKDFDLPKKNYLGLSYSYSKFLNDSSPQPYYFIRNNFNAFYKKKFSWLVTKLSFDYDFGDNTVYYKTVQITYDTIQRRSRQIIRKRINVINNYKRVSIYDYTLTWSNYKKFYIDRWHLFSKKDEISFTPKFSITAGTQNAYLIYFVTRYPTRLSRLEVDPEVKKGIKSIRDSTKSDKFNNTKFLILNYQLGLTFGYSINKFSFDVIFHLCSPQNQPDPLDNKIYSYYNFNLTWDF